MPKNLAMFVPLGVLFAAALFVAKVMDMAPSQDDYKALVEEQFHLPDDIEYASFVKSDVARRGTGIEAIVQFTPSQFADYEAKLDDPTVWRHIPFRYNGTTVDPEGQRSALRWYDNIDAFITKDRSFALFWLRWGRSHSKPDDGGTPINGARPWKSLCFAVMQPEYESRMRACNDLPANNTPENLFAPGQRPAFYVRALIDRIERRLYVHVR